jgi:hypothetical protein
VQDIAADGGLALISTTMVTLLTNEDVVAEGVALLKTLAHSDGNKKAFCDPANSTYSLILQVWRHCSARSWGGVVRCSFSVSRRCRAADDDVLGVSEGGGACAGRRHRHMPAAAGELHCVRGSWIPANSAAGAASLSISMFMSLSMSLSTSLSLSLSMSLSISLALSFTLSLPLSKCKYHCTVAQVMRAHESSIGVQRQACACIRNLVARNVELRAVVLDEGFEVLIRRARLNHSK